MKSHATKNDLKSNTKKVSIEILNARLAEAIDLALVTKQAHWNVKGPHFIAIHEMLDGFRKDLDEHVDTIAERVVQLGGTALGTVQVVAATSKLPAYPTDIYSTKDHLAALIDRYAATAKRPGRSTRRTKPATPTPPTSSPPIPARSTSRCGSSKRTSRKRINQPANASDGRVHPTRMWSRRPAPS